MQHELVMRARDGDHEAFAALAGMAFTRLQRTARLILRDEDRAADAVQDALVSAWLHIRSVRDPDRFDAWLNRLIVRACYSEARRRRRREIIEIRPLAADVRGDGDTQDRVAMRDQLERAFRRLSPEQRAVLVVHHYLGLTDVEAAVVLEIPAATVKSRRNRATAAMRASVDADERLAFVAEESIA